MKRLRLVFLLFLLAVLVAPAAALAEFSNVTITPGTIEGSSIPIWKVTADYAADGTGDAGSFTIGSRLAGKLIEVASTRDCALTIQDSDGMNLLESENVVMAALGRKAVAPCPFVGGFTVSVSGLTANQTGRVIFYVEI